MGFFELMILAVGLSMDAFAVSICKGLALRKIGAREGVIVGLWFGGFQALMPLVGYFLGVQFKDGIMAYDHWIAFALLSLIGVNMIRESFASDGEEADASLSWKAMLPLAVADSIDALAAGVTFAFLPVNIWTSVSLIGVTTFALSWLGVKVGSVFGGRYKRRAERAGGIVLVLLGVKILLEHTGVL